jgi:hypothetical protein
VWKAPAFRSTESETRASEINKSRIKFLFCKPLQSGQRLSFNRKGSRLAEVRRGGSLWLHQS